MRTKGFVKHYYLMLLPGMIWLTLFSIVPMFGIVIAFQDYNPGLGILHSDWVGLDNFRYMFSLGDSGLVFRNTIVIAVMKIVANLIVPLVFALMLHEVQLAVMKKWVQTIVYLPHFLSWVILAGILLDVFAYKGPVNQILSVFGMEPILFFARADLFPFLIVGSDVWKEFGFNTIIFLAALTGINPSLYEAAAIDGATRWQRLLHVTLPGIVTTIILLAVLSLGNVLNAGFDQIFNLYNPLVYSTGDIIDTWVYRTGLVDLQYGLATATGLLKSVISFILITVSYLLASRFAGYRIF
ncbi:ABC transporter permease [Paenibacillus mucilaginosus]|uniref:Binding-protein-dependent transport systems inner membrane component n=3 Tax=Paenibacillus mucilaginosus TaxID=61624 RepID=H6NN15_9BACL|nr:ABC transporter permease subunit [Paenibacillus mucilaginosus]AEI43404.1 binding-protein-dependent transport systems inner membrane component [Paenibacillus mucilaginosus KNP414]AFC31055.1 binding-protein-dependent transport systems inner membrane component [Paenibacillus mucilaginosus 3016]AFH63373.1 sugar ABC transporter permease [Paenibacillus mucilaginosus K02]MCG7212049.1 ABC transporter permease subunit [Paenibacillus mucilaginosus]WDM24965.1 sugar ABC transporter permease [Paenibacil